MKRGAANTLRANVMHIYPRIFSRIAPFERKKVKRQIAPNPNILSSRSSFTVWICIKFLALNDCQFRKINYKYVYVCERDLIRVRRSTTLILVEIWICKIIWTSGPEHDSVYVYVYMGGKDLIVCL